jgi:hypothetical protein
MSEADKYRDRPTEEIMGERKELEQLRYQSLRDQTASWYWSRDEYAFIVNEHWQTLTGYDPKEWFPQNLSRSVPIEHLLDNLIDKWINAVFEEDRAEVKEAVEKFLLFNHSDQALEKAYRIICGDGTRKAILTTARSIWRNGRLMHLFVQSRDISNISKPLDQAIAISKNADAIASNQTHLDSLEANAETLKRLALIIAALIPILSSLVIAFNGLLQDTAKAIKTTLSLWNKPPSVIEAPLDDETFRLGSLDQQSMDAIAEIMKQKTPIADRLKLSVYEPGPAPSRYRLLILAQQGAVDSNYYYSVPRATGGSSRESMRTQQHMSNQPAEITEARSGNAFYQFSTPLQIERRDGTLQTFFVSAEGQNVDEDQASEMQAATRELAANIKPILENALGYGY